ncbi:Arm repeat-containing protein, partial [Globisporangium splendens]
MSSPPISAQKVTEMMAQPAEDTTEEETELLMWNVLEELAPRAASASSDRHAGELIEVFMPKMSDGQLRYFFSKMHGYFSHLWTNRYSSHVLQNLLSRSSSIVEKEQQGATDNPNDDDDRLKETPPMSHLIITMVKEVENEWLTLMNDVSASHVMRSVLAALAGKPLVAEKRGKKAKHRVVTFGEAPSSKDGSVIKYEVPSAFDDLFNEILMSFMSSHETVNLMFDRNSGPLIASALKLAPVKSKKMLVERVLRWDDEEASIKAFNDFAGDAVTSHFIEALFTSIDDKFFTKIFRRCVKGKIVEFAQHNIANYVVQNAIERVSSLELANEVLQELQHSLWTLLSMGRPGVVWRLVEMCVKFKLQQKEIFGLLVEAVKKQESKKPEAVRKDFVPALLNLQLSTSGTAKINLNVMGAKIIAELMKFEYADWVAPLYKGVLGLNIAQLVALAKDSTGSRFLIEPIWESDTDETKWVRDALYERFVGNFGSLAMDRLGAFSVMKCFEKLELPQKVVVAEELLQVESKLAGSHFSQLVMNTCNLFEFRNNREKWEALYEKKTKIAELFKDVVDDENDASGTKKKSKKKSRKSADDSEKDEKKSKKKRKHISADDDERSEQRKELAEKSADVASIMDALRGGTASTKKAKKSSKKHKNE